MLRAVVTYVPRPLRVGDRVRIHSDSPVREVTRVSPGAAYLSGDPKTSKITCRDCRFWESRGTKPPEGEKCSCREFTTRGDSIAVSLNAFVYPAGE